MKVVCVIKVRELPVSRYKAVLSMLSIVLNKEQDAIAFSLLSGHNVFFSGPAGCGKSRIFCVLHNLLVPQDLHLSKVKRYVFVLQRVWRPPLSADVLCTVFLLLGLQGDCHSFFPDKSLPMKLLLHE